MKFTVFITGSVMTDFLPVCRKCFLMRKAKKRHSHIFFYVIEWEVRWAPIADLLDTVVTRTILAGS